MNEFPCNIGLTSRMPNPDPGGVYSKKPKEFFIGKYVQLAFPCDDCYEFMWVEVKEETPPDVIEEFLGVLNNDPVVATEYADGDTIGFSRNEIERVSEGESNG